MLRRIAHLLALAWLDKKERGERKDVWLFDRDELCLEKGRIVVTVAFVDSETVTDPPKWIISGNT